jgi:WD repeat-containing protein 76
VFTGDSEGHLAIFDGSDASVVESDDYDVVVADISPRITLLRPHRRAINSISFHYSDVNSVYTASYDGSVRKLDLAKGESVEVYAPAAPNMDDPITTHEILQSDPNMLRFSTVNGRLGIHDLRTGAIRNSTTKIFQLTDKKIGGFGSHPNVPHIFATASLDRTLKLWDLRKLSGSGVDRMPHLVGEHVNRLSVSHASFNQAGQIATTSYDNTVKIYDFQSVADLEMGGTFSEQEMQPKVQIPHNNQTGKWVSM